MPGGPMITQPFGPGGFSEEDRTSFEVTLPSAESPEGQVTTTPSGDSYRSLRERYGLPALDELGEISPQTQAESLLTQAGVNIDDPAVRSMLAEPAFQEILQGENAPGMLTFLRDAYPATPTTAYDDAVLASGFQGGFVGPVGVGAEPGQLAALTSGTDTQIAKFRKETPGYEENPDTGWIRYPNGVLVSPDGQVAFDPTSTAPGSLKWQREVVSGWSPEQVSSWADRLADHGYLTKEQAKKVTSNDPAFLGALSSYHVNRYIYGKPVSGELAGGGAAADRPPLVDFEELQAQTRNFVREQYRRVYGEDPTDGEVVAFSDAITNQAMTLQKRFRRKEMPGFSGLAATEAEERFVEKLEGSPEATFLRESEEENTRLRDSLQQAVAVTNSLAG